MSNELYYSKYLKYKNKYLELQNSVGGASGCISNSIGNCQNFPGCSVNYYDENGEKSKYPRGCKQKHCLGRSIPDCMLTTNCNVENDKCIPNCKQYNNIKEYTNKPAYGHKNQPPENEYFCTAVKECSWDKQTKICKQK